MQQGLVALVLGLVGGVAGGLGVGLLAPEGVPGGSGDVVRHDGDVEARLERLEAARAAAAEEGEARLRGRAEAAVGGPPGPADPALVDVLEARLVERLTPRLDAAVEEKVKELAAAEDPSDEPKGRPRLPLSEVAREVGLSGAEEDDLRRIYEETKQKYLEILAKPDGDVDQVRRDLESLEDEANRPKLLQKYMPKFLTSIGEIIAVEAEKETRIQKAVGPDKASLLDDYNIVEARPFNMEANLDVRSGNGR